MNVTNKKNITQVHRIRFDDGTKDTFKQPKISYMLLKSYKWHHSVSQEGLGNH
jgi:hypothetical protein